MINLGLRFVLEIILLFSLVYWGFHCRSRRLAEYHPWARSAAADCGDLGDDHLAEGTHQAADRRGPSH